MAKSKVSVGKCHIALESIWVIFKYLSILISNVIPGYVSESPRLQSMGT